MLISIRSCAVAIVAFIAVGLALAQGPSEPIRGFSSTRYIQASPLPLGFDLNDAGMVRLVGDASLEGLAFVYISPTSFPLAEGFRDWVPPFFEAAQAHPGRIYWILSGPGTLRDRQARNYGFPEAPEDFFADPLWEALEGPWTLWLDLEDVVGEVANIYAPNGLSRGTFDSYACVRDGQVLTSYSDWLTNGNWPESGRPRLERLIKDCLNSRIDEAHATVPYPGPTPAANFTLRAETGETLTLADLHTPFALLNLPLGSDNAGYDYGQLLEAAERALQIADVPIYVLALPSLSYQGEEPTFHDAREVASVLRDELSIPVFEDVQGDFTLRYSYYLRTYRTLIVFDGEGNVLDAFIPTTMNPPLPPSLSQVLLEGGLF